MSVESDKRTWEDAGGRKKPAAEVRQDKIEVAQAIQNVDNRRKKSEKKKALDVVRTVIEKAFTLEDF